MNHNSCLYIYFVSYVSEQMKELYYRQVMKQSYTEAEMHLSKNGVNTNVVSV